MLISARWKGDYYGNFVSLRLAIVVLGFIEPWLLLLACYRVQDCPVSYKPHFWTFCYLDIIFPQNHSLPPEAWLVIVFTLRLCYSKTTDCVQRERNSSRRIKEASLSTGQQPWEQCGAFVAQKKLTSLVLGSDRGQTCSISPAVLVTAL